MLYANQFSFNKTAKKKKDAENPPQEIYLSLALTLPGWRTWDKLLNLSGAEYHHL